MKVRFAAARRVVKDGGYGVVWSYPKTMHWTMLALDYAGWTIEDIVAHIFSNTINKGRNDEDGNNERLWPQSEYWILVSNKKKVKRPCGLRTGFYRFGEDFITRLGAAVKLGVLNRKKRKEEHILRQGRSIGTVIHDGVLSAYIGERSKSFYCLKSSLSDYEENGRHLGNDHPTVKRLPIMRLMVDLTTPEGGKVLDIFSGSGTTGVACVDLGNKYVGIEMDESYSRVAADRISERLAKWEMGTIDYVRPEKRKGIVKLEEEKRVALSQLSLLDELNEFINDAESKKDKKEDAEVKKEKKEKKEIAAVAEKKELKKRIVRKKDGVAL
jgi:hypothetical protein